MGFLLLDQVLTGLRILPSANGYPQNIVPLFFKGQDFSPDKRMADGGILIDKIGDAHHCHSCEADVFGDPVIVWQDFVRR